MKTIRTGALFALLGILLGPVLLNLIGFMVPVLSVPMESIDQAGGGRELLPLAARFIAPTSILFLIAAWLLTPPETNRNGRVLAFRMLVRAAAVSWAAVSVLTVAGMELGRVRSVAWTALAVLGLLQVARICSNLGRNRLAAATVIALVVGVGTGMLPAPDPTSPSSIMLVSGVWLAMAVASTVTVVLVLLALRRIPVEQ